MIAIVPPDDLAARLAIEDGEDPAQLHVTLAYLGQTGDYRDVHLDNLRETVAAWAEANEPLKATVQGAGTFVKATEAGQHVLWASVDAPGLERMHVTLVDYLLERGYHPSMDHVFIPHMTLSYAKHHVRFLPKIERETWDVTEVWVCIAGRWESVTLGSEEVHHERTAGRGKPRRDQSSPGGGDPASSGQQGEAPDAGGDGRGTPRPVTYHARVPKDLAKLHPQVQKRIRDTIDRLAVDDPSLQTHPLSNSLKGWLSTKVSHDHRVVHQPDGEGGIYVGYVGLHGYGDVESRFGRG
jgi:2'-5' RNA ligase/mRNA-degrading endonuclease YafQ of YafQ-DinJ toxin-antitoxin module